MLRRKVEWAWQRGDTKGVCLIGSHGAGESIVAVPALGKWGVAVWEHRGLVGADSEAPSICQRSVQSGGLDAPQLRLVPSAQTLQRAHAQEAATLLLSLGPLAV